MALSINTNMSMMGARADFIQIEREAHTVQQRLSSGQRINSAKDDSAQLSISEGMRAEFGSLTEGTRNAEKALDLLLTAEGAMGEISGMLVRLRELATQATTDTLNNGNREGLDAEMAQLTAEIDHIARQTSYNDQVLLSGFGNQADAAASTALAASPTTGIARVKLSGATAGTYTFIDNPADATITLGNGVVTQTLSIGTKLQGDRLAAGTTAVVDFDRLGVQLELAGEQALNAPGAYIDGALDGHTLVVTEGNGTFQLGSDAIPADRLDYDIKDMDSAGPILNIAGLSIGTRDAARQALAQLDGAIGRVSRERGAVGAVINRLGHTLEYSANALENVKNAESSIRDADYAAESTALARNQIMRQANQSVMIQSRFRVEMLMGLLQ